MDDPNITLEEYIRLEEEKSQRHGRTFNWQTTTYGKMEYYEDEDDIFMNFETEYTSIVFDDTSDATLSCKPTVKNDNDKVNMPSSPSPEPMIGYIDGLDFFNDFENEFPAIAYNDDLKSKLDPLIEPSDQRHLWLRAPLVWEFILEFLSTCRMSDMEMGLDVADTLCFQLGEAGFGAYWQGSERVIPDKGDLRDYWMEISISSKGQAPEKVTGVDLFYLRSMDQWTANVSYLLAQYLFRHAEGRKSGASGARLFRGHFIRRLATHFGLVSDQGLRGLSVVTSELLLIDLHELGRLNVCLRVGDTWAWVAPRPKRQPDAAAGALRAAEDAPAADEGA
ncbi:hypothetical protein Tco_0084629 [Tanacetum coccineum]